MKKIQSLAVLLLTVALYAGCTKDTKNNPLTASNNMVYTSNSPAFPVGIGFRLAFQQSGPGSVINWNNGYFNANSIVFNSVHTNGNELVKVSYSTLIRQVVDLYRPGILGSVYVPRLVSDHASFTIGLDNLNSGNSMFLSGTYQVQAGRILPVQVIVNEPALINSVWLNKFSTESINSGMATIMLNMDQVTAGIDARMMNNAVIINNTIMITNTYNKSIYQLIINNLEGYMMQVQFQPEQPLSVPFPVSKTSPPPANQ